MNSRTPRPGVRKPKGLQTSKHWSDSIIVEQPGERTAAFWLSEGLLIAAIPILGYSLAFAYEVGFATVFGIPIEFLTFELTKILTVAGLLTILSPLVLLVGFIPAFLFRHSNLISRLVSPYIPSLIMIGILLYLHLTRWQEWITLVVVMGVFAAVDFGAPLVTQRGKATYSEKLLAENKEFRKQLAGTIIHNLVNRVGRTGLMAVLVVWLTVYSAYSVGRAQAFDQTHFLVPSTSPEWVVLRIYGDKVIIAPLDRTSGGVQKSFGILKLGEDPSLVLSREKVGPLHIQEP